MTEEGIKNAKLKISSTKNFANGFIKSHDHDCTIVGDLFLFNFGTLLRQVLILWSKTEYSYSTHRSFSFYNAVAA